MNTNEILFHIDSLLKESRLDEAEKYMKATLSDAEKSDRPDIMLTLYNELAGFYRDCGRFAEALESCRRSEVLLEKMKEQNCLVDAYLRNREGVLVSLPCRRAV